MKAGWRIAKRDSPARDQNPHWIDEPALATATGREQEREAADESGVDRAEVIAFLLRELTAVLHAEEEIDRDQGFLEVGGDSFTAMMLLTSVEERYACELPLESFDIDSGVGAIVEELAERVVEAAAEGKETAV